LEAPLAVTDPWQTRSNALAFGRLDVDEDGLMDLVRANDTFSVAWARNTLAAPGGVLQRCSPDRDCLFDERRFAPGLDAWGSYMGIGNLSVAGLGEVLYLTDAGPNRAIRFDDEWTGEDHAGGGALGQGYTTNLLGERTEFLRFSWGVVVDDFNADGLDDLFVTNGGIFSGPFLENQVPGSHEDALLIQASDGTFSDVSESVGVVGRGSEDSLLSDSAYLARGALKVDFDLDGQLEIIEAARRGQTRLYTVVEAREPVRCTLLPRPTVANGAGFGFAVYTASSGWRRWDIAGQYWTAAPPNSLVAPERTGVLRFPSGFELPFDCGEGAGPLRLEEPDWLRVSVGSEIVVRLEGVTPASVEISVDGGPAVLLSLGDDGAYRHSAGIPESSVMLRLNGRWIARDWFL
jgi:hypothetical protein